MRPSSIRKMLDQLRTIIQAELVGVVLLCAALMAKGMGVVG